MSLSSASYQSKSRQSFVFVVTAPLLAANVDNYVYTFSRPGKIVDARINLTVAGSDGGAVTLNIRKCAAGTAPASGTSVLASTVDLKSTAATPVAATLSSTSSVLLFEAGDSVSFDYTGTLTALVGAATLTFQTR
jgi:hypothetical protein